MTQSSGPGAGSLATGKLREIGFAFLRLGFIAFGGAVAHIALMEDEFVRKRKWLSREDFVDRVGAVNLLPGPSSTELSIYLGFLRGRLPGLAVAGAAFILPSALMMCALGWVYVRFGATPRMGALLTGIKPIVLVLIAQAVWSLGRTVLRSRELALLAAVVLALAAMKVPALPLLVGTGVAWMAAARFAEKPRIGPLAAAGAAALGMPWSWPAAGGLGLAVYFLKIGALLFGSGYVLLAVLREDLVTRLHWLSETQLLDAVAISQATPGPFFTVATFIGFLLKGWSGAGLATLAMFTPAFLYVAVTARVLPPLRKSPAAGAFLDGVNAAAVALMAFVGLEFAREVLLSLPAAVIFGAGAFLAFRYRCNSAWLIAGGAVAGLLAKLAAGVWLR
jgi:chromate transporter